MQVIWSISIMILILLLVLQSCNRSKDCIPQWRKQDQLHMRSQDSIESRKVTPSLSTCHWGSGWKVKIFPPLDNVPGKDWMITRLSSFIIFCGKSWSGMTMEDIILSSHPAKRFLGFSGTQGGCSLVRWYDATLVKFPKI